MSTAPAVELDGQYRALREGAGVFRREGRRIIELVGSEGAEFLQGQLTNEIEGLQPGTGCYAALLDRKGKMRADMRVLRLAADRIWVEADESAIAEVSDHLNTYKIGRDVELQTLADPVVVGLIGPMSVAALGGKPLAAVDSHSLERIAENDVRVIATEDGADLIVAGDAAEAVTDELIRAGADPVSAAAVEIIRVEAGRPAFGAEMGNETIPQEAGINERAVNFEKGCYIGQETVARLHYKGKPNRHLRRLRSRQPLSVGDPVRLGERELGTVGTAVISPAAGPLALAILRREAEPGTEVTVGDGLTATVEAVEERG